MRALKICLRVSLLGLLCVSAGCLALHRPAPLGWSPGELGVIFVADGAGDFRAASNSLRNVVHEEAVPIRVDPFVWSHGFCRIFKDELHYAYARAQGERLAAEIIAFHQAHPLEKVYLVGHSAGAIVALAAAESLPPCSLESIAVLAPSLSANYDLRPALRSVRGHVDVYYSCKDWLYLGVGTQILGTPDRGPVPCSGRTGFRVMPTCPKDQWLLHKLRQHAWEPHDRSAGNHGGHYGAYHEKYLRARVLPLLLEAGPPDTAPPVQVIPELPPPRTLGS